MTRLACERDARAGLPGDRADDPDGKPFPLEHGSLLDVHLDVAGELGRRWRDGLLGIATRAADRVAEA